MGNIECGEKSCTGEYIEIILNPCIRSVYRETVCRTKTELSPDGMKSVTCPV